MTIAAATTVRFAYQARDQRGQVVNGFVSAATLVEATKSLRAEGKYIVDIKPARGGAAAAPKPEGAPADSNGIPLDEVGKNTRINREELIHFTMQVSVMVDTGVPLSDALHSLSEQAFTARMRAMAGDGPVA